MLTPSEQLILMQIARSSITNRWYPNRDNALDAMELTAALRAPGASFVTLHSAGKLRGCIGSLHAHQPLAQDVASNARAAAFNDPRFTPVVFGEWPHMQLDISVLSLPQTVLVDNEQDLLQILRPGIDGVVLEQQGRRATFLPQVWEHFDNDAKAFLAALRQKAGLSATYDGRGCYSVYQVQKFGDGSEH